MKDNQHIEKKIRDLPKYSLNSDQKHRIMMRLNAEQSVKKKVVFRPLVALFASLALLFILVVYEFNGNNDGNVSIINQTKHDLAELNAPEAKQFTLSDTKQEVIGIKGKVALLNVFDHFVSKDERRVSKLMIFYWGNPTELVGKNYRVEAVNRYGEKVTMSEGKLSSALNSEDAHTLTKFLPFTSEGNWQLSFYVEEKLHGEFALEVLPPFPKTEHYVLMDSPKETKVGEESEITIESSWKNKEEIEVCLVNNEGKVVEQDIFKQDAMHYDASSYDPIYLFSGKLKFPRQGTWTLIIDGEKTNVFNN